MMVDMLADYGNELREPYTKCIGDGIFELRIKSGSDISRVIYFFYVGKRIILTNGFIKKTNKTPKCEIELAQKYRQDYLNRGAAKNDWSLSELKRQFNSSLYERLVLSKDKKAVAQLAIEGQIIELPQDYQ